MGLALAGVLRRFPALYQLRAISAGSRISSRICEVPRRASPARVDKSKKAAAIQIRTKSAGYLKPYTSAQWVRSSGELSTATMMK
jgi:hypothetical protein